MASKNERPQDQPADNGKIPNQRQAPDGHGTPNQRPSGYTGSHRNTGNSK